MGTKSKSAYDSGHASLEETLGNRGGQKACPGGL